MVKGNLAKKLLAQTSDVVRDYTFLPDKPKHTSVSLLDIVKNKYRFEASAFNLEAKAAFNKVKNCKYGFSNLWDKDGLVEDAFYPGRFKRIYVSKGEGYPFYLPSQLTEIYPKPTKYISEKTYNQIKGIEIKNNKLLLTRSGTIGKCSISSKTNVGKVYSDDVIRVSFKGKHDLGYVYAYIQSEIGQLILKTNNYGSVVQHIEPEHLENVIIPNAPEEIKRKVHELVVKSYDLRDKSNELMDIAEKILYEELQLPPIEQLQPEYFDTSKEIRNYETKLSDLNLRLDGSYHLPIVKLVEKAISKNSNEIKLLGSADLTSNIVLPGRFSRTYVSAENGVQFLGGRDLFQLNPTTEKLLSKSEHKKQIEGDLRISNNDILTPSRGSIGRVVLAPKHFDTKVISDNIINVRPSNSRTAGYLYCFLNSDYGSILIKRQIYGAVVDAMEPAMMANVEIPILKNEGKQTEINLLVLKANEQRYEAHLKEQEAIRVINEDVINETKQNQNLAAEPKVKYQKLEKN